MYSILHYPSTNIKYKLTTMVVSPLSMALTAMALNSPQVSRRSCLIAVSTALVAQPAMAATDCFKDCLKNCKQIAPKDNGYCQESCSEYCEQPDRRDGLSGSVSAEGGEVGLLGGTFGTGTVVKGEDKPPSFSLPGLDFTSKGGRKLLGY